MTDIDLAIPEGEFFSLLGPSGCGKTTLLRIIAGFETPTDGQVLLHGDDVTCTPPNLREVNLVFQQYALFPHLSVFDNIAFGLKRKRVDKSEIRRRVDESLALVQLEHVSKRKPSQLSGGQQQRVALARALVNRPRALLLDEPLAALDLKLRHAMQEELKRIQAEVGITFIFVTHDQGEAMAMSDRIAVLDSGRLAQVGTPRELYNEPATKFVANFIGATTMFAAVVESDGRSARLPGGDIVGLPERAETGEAITIAVRPERIAVASVEVGSESPAGLSGSIDDCEFLGPVVNYTVRLKDGTPVRATESVTDATARLLRPGDPVTLTWNPGAASIIAN
ncbi:ABC transporter ATP-binding protein [Mycobacterium sp. CBMA247]|nr:ABC transporter ATP-binding protein [Mycolicibacterium sp. CBMA 329]MUL88156.1 ABC transporter ATP-binding protein [Mycolicibacterium sp. CBMA 331]MUM02455.1 ABC transporter ATP-binding protein [Mycolicibacterium sp. CBMA 334]MUM25998.1 ABC transporter ATP-binding protein [Mycolicibacterium sp. CBMA 295]MUM39803.1 ABC transporter ATP-binding protein [Mycolicibacterium sp. CBMA 247]MUM44221.1 ABC transporter ATP-binding protein [Mycolicibacterium sp. CBMA 294]